ncbi:MAG: GntR family transcriptional regulator [Desulfuromonadales bacterium]
MRRKQIERHQTLREKILETIRDAILKGTLKPGERVSEPELAERFGISRTPIREAFRQLESEGYLKVIPRKGAVVASLSERDVEEFYTIKIILEGFAARMAAEKLTDKDIERLEAINNRLAEIAKQGDVKNFFRVHNEFHEMFIKAAGNERLSEMINQLVMKFKRLRLASLSQPGRMEISVEQHRNMIQAFKTHDGDRADNLVRQPASLVDTERTIKTGGVRPARRLPSNPLVAVRGRVPGLHNEKVRHHDQRPVPGIPG